jgi:hypothetical protein
MARQKGIIKLKGMIGNDHLLPKKKDDHLDREKQSIDTKRIATNPAFNKT